MTILAGKITALLLSLSFTLLPPVSSDAATNGGEAAATREATQPVTETAAPASLSDEEVLALFTALEEKACRIADWYFEENREALGIGAESPHAPYYKVGIMGTVDEMRAATDAVFTEGFAAAYFYDHAFGDPGGSGTPLYKEIGGALYRDVDQGGMGWPHGLEGTQSVAYRDENTIIIGARTYLPGGETDWTNFLLRKENGVWKFDVFYSFNRYMSYSSAFPRQREGELSAAVSSWLAAVDWTDANQLGANSLLNLYEYFYLKDVDLSTVENYMEKGYPLPSGDLMAGLAAYLNGLKKETLTAINEEQGTSATYDKAADTFYFDVTFDPADFIVTGMEQNGAVTTLTVMVIGKSGEAVYESLLTLEVNGSDVKFVGNRMARDFRA